MFFSVQNLGRIESAKIDLSKNLTIFCGPNNTGKTFLSYTIYGLSVFNEWEGERLNFLMEQLEKLSEDGEVEIDLYKLVLENKEYLYRNTSKSIHKNLSNILGVESDKLKEAKVALSWDEENLLNDIKNYRFPLGGIGFGGASVNFKKPSDSATLKISSTTIKTDKVAAGIELENYKLVHDLILGYLMAPLDSPKFFLPAERIGIVVFGKELLSNRFSLTSELRVLDESNRKVVHDYIKSRTGFYSKAIQDSILFQESAKKERRVNEDFVQLAEEIENKILNGKISTDESNNVFYDFGKNKIAIQQAASTIKSLSSLVLFLKSKAHANNVIFFDEPEINLHPDNQRLIARIIAKLVNKGIRIYLSTHSDYIIRELNNLILLEKYKSEPSANELMKRYSYETTELLETSKIAVYTFDLSKSGSVNVNLLPFTLEGINISSINSSINNQNLISQDIYMSLVETDK